MFKYLKYFKNQVLLNKRLTEEEKRQKKEGYSIESINGPEQYVIYRESKREVTAGMSFTFLNDVRLYTNSFVKWDIPRGEKLTPFDYQKVLNRLIRYFSCWGGDVILDDVPLQDLEQLMESLRQEGIPFKEVDGVTVYESTVEEERKRKDSPFFSGK